MPRSNRARNNFFFGKKEPVAAQSDYWPWLTQVAQSIPYREDQQYLVRFPDRRGRWAWYYVSYLSERAFSEASESSMPIGLIQDENPWSVVRLNMQSTRHPEELSLVVLDAKTQTVTGPLTWNEVRTKRNPRREEKVDIAYAIRRTQTNILSLRDMLIEQREKLVNEGLPEREIHARVHYSPEGQMLSYEFQVLKHLQAAEALRRAFGPSREHEEVRANSGSDDARKKQQALIRRLEEKLKEEAQLLELQGMKLHQIREFLMNSDLAVRIRAERAILDRLQDTKRLEQVFRHRQGPLPVAEANPAFAAIGSIAAQVATSIVLNLGAETWHRVLAMSVPDRAKWLHRTAQTASWLTGAGGLVYKYAPVGDMREKLWLEVSSAMSSPEVQVAVQDAVQGAANTIRSNPLRAQPTSHYKHFLDAEAGSWPIWRRDTGFDHARVSVQFMARGFGNKKDYPKLIARMATLIPPSDPSFAHIWEFYSRSRAGIERMRGGPMPTVESLSLKSAANPSRRRARRVRLRKRS